MTPSPAVLCSCWICRTGNELIRWRVSQQCPRSRQRSRRPFNGPRRIRPGNRRRLRVKVLRRVAGAPKPLECRLGECRYILGELSGHGILDGHVRSVASRGAQTLTCKERLRSHPVSVIGSDISAIDVTARKSSGSSSVNAKRCAREQCLCQIIKALCPIFSSRPLSTRYRTVRLPFSQPAIPSPGVG